MRPPAKGGKKHSPKEISPARQALPGLREAAFRQPAPETGAHGPAVGNWLWGHHAVIEALANPERKLLRIIATADSLETFSAQFADQPLSPQKVTKDELQRMLPPGAVHQGLAALFRPLRAQTIEDVIERAENVPDALVVALDQVTDPHNIGAILRSAAAFGALAVILPDRNAPETISGTLAKSASGAVEHVPLVRVVNLTRSLELLKKAGFWVAGLAGDAERTLAQHNLSGRVCLALGSEGDGLRRLTRETCDIMAKLPTSGPIASLNVSNAAAIALYELRRTRA